MKRAVAIAAMTLLTGCFGTWKRDNTTEAEFNRDKYECQTEVAQTYPVQMVQTGYNSGYTTPSQTNCTGYGNTMRCQTTPGVTYVQPSTTSTDANSINRAFAFNSCMQARGYTR